MTCVSLDTLAGLLHKLGPIPPVHLQVECGGYLVIVCAMVYGLLRMFDD